MSIDHANVIDFLVNDKRTNRAILAISDHLDWKHDEKEHVRLLQDKLNHYIWFIESGKLVETMPELQGLPIVILVWAKYRLSAYANQFYAFAKVRVSELGVSLEFDLKGKAFEKR
jgi:hypothetical protein